MSEQPESTSASNATNQPTKYEVPAEGSLGLLALGHIGLKLWRDKRKEVFEQSKADRKALENDKKESNE